MLGMLERAGRWRLGGWGAVGGRDVGVGVRMGDRLGW